MKTDPEYASIKEASTLAFFFRRQWLHLAGLVLLVPICWAFAAPALGDGAWLGVSDTQWFWASVVAAVVHQVIVAFIFRAQLGWSILTRIVGRADMIVWGIVFMPLLIARPLLIVGLAMADAGSADLPRWFELAAGTALMVPAVYALVFLGLWAIALFAGSRAALAAALFQHSYIWVHYYCTEAPDMELIYD
jgi:hypothetical protein